ncbi:MAG: hypothetical protein HRU01_00940 [Myxococcales bacterium]|nr:hypothetical protein [Myxococcales bacterium]
MSRGEKRNGRGTSREGVISRRFGAGASTGGEARRHRRRDSAARPGRGVATRAVSRDYAHRSPPQPRRPWLPALIAAALLASMLLAVLRVDLIRVRYARGQAKDVEMELREQRNRLRARVRTLRDPALLSELALELGFARPERAIDLRPRIVADAALGPRP